MIEQYKTGFSPPGDVPFEDLSVLVGLNMSTSNSSAKPETVRGGTEARRQKKRTGLLALFNTTRVISSRFLLRLSLSPWRLQLLVRTC